MMIMTLPRENRSEREHLINTALQGGDGQRHQTRTALAVFTPSQKTAEAVCTLFFVVHHLAEARR